MAQVIVKCAVPASEGAAIVGTLMIIQDKTGHRTCIFPSAQTILENSDCYEKHNLDFLSF
jgi:hypothetical protein